MSTTINQQALEQFIVKTIGKETLLKSESHRYDINDVDFGDADGNDDNVLDLDELLNEDTGVYEKFATLYQQELRQEQEAKEEEKKKEEADEQRTTGQGGSGV